MLVTLILLAFLAAAAETSDEADACSCATALETNGWCEAHGAGYIASIRIPSKLLWETLDAHGHTLELSTFECESCKAAIGTDGFCAEHRIGFIGGQAYFSRLTYELARGETTVPARISCPVCRKHAESHGWCETCGVGMVGNVVAVDEASYREMARAMEILGLAVDAASRCEHCAMAIVTDTQCSRCRITYRDGKPVAGPADPRR